jgi:hypothetical protein
MREHNSEYPNKKVSLAVLKAVFRRGAGAYSSSHRPTISGGKPNSRTAWAYARVNRFLEKKAGKQVKKAYVQDDDLIWKYHLGGDMSKHLAPNGKPSNLTHEQWHLVRTPEFKAWFGDWENDPENASKVVDDNGEPLVVYHSTDKKFTKFDYNLSYDGAIWFTENLEKLQNREAGASASGIIYEVFLKIDKLGDWDDYDKGISSLLQEKFNGAKLDDDYIVFEPNQIKLADGSNTTFNGSNPDIRFADGGYLDKDQFVSKALLFSPQYWRRRVPFLKAFDVYGNYENMETLYFKLFEPQYNVTTLVNDKFFSFKLSPKYILEVEEMKDDKVSITLFPKYVMRDFDMPYDRIEEEIEHFEIQFINAFRKTEQELSLNFELHPTKRDMDAIIDKIDKYFFEMIDFSDEIGFGVMFEKGGLIDPEKAKQILEDGKIRGRKLTDKQRRFFWASALRKMANGNLLDTKIEDSPLRGKSLKEVSDLSEIYTLAEKYKVGTGEIRKEFFKGIEVEREHTGDYGLSAQIALNHLNEDKDYYTKLQTLKLEKGGELKAENNEKEIIHNSGSAGGVLVGRRHSEGGIRAINRATGQPLELEGGEVVITRDAVSDNQKYEFEGEMLTNRQILSRINVSGGGVSFEDGGEIDECGCSGHKYNYGGEVLEDYEIVKRMARGGATKSQLGNPSFNRTGIQFNWEEFVEDSKQFLIDEKYREYSKMDYFTRKYEGKKVLNAGQSFTEEWLEDYIVSLALNVNYKLKKDVIRRFVDRNIFYDVLQKSSFKKDLLFMLGSPSYLKIKKIVKNTIGSHQFEFLNDLKDFTTKEAFRENLKAITTEKGIGSENFSFVASDAYKLIHFPNVNVTNELAELIEQGGEINSLLPKEKGKIESLSQLELTNLKINWRVVVKDEKYVSSSPANAVFFYDLFDRLVILNDVFSPITEVPIFRYDIDLGLENATTTFNPEMLRDIVYFLTKYSPSEKVNYSIKLRLMAKSTAICYINYAQNNFTETSKEVMSNIVENEGFGVAMPIVSTDSTPEKPFFKVPNSYFFNAEVPKPTPEAKEEPKEEIPNSNITNQEVQEQIDALMLVIQYSDKEDEISEAQDLIDALKLLLD